MRLVRWVVFSAVVLLTPATTFAQQCSRYDRWSIDAVEQLTGQANLLTYNGSLPDCEGQNWYICKQVDDLLFEVQEHLDQVFRGEAAGPGYRCLNCEMDALVHGAGVLRAWAEWLDQRYYKYRGAYGNLLETFQGYSGLPLCTTIGPPPPPPPPPPGSTALCPNLPGDPLEAQPSLYMETAGGAVWDRGFVNFYFNPRENLYCGYPAAGGSADFTGQYLTQEGHEFVLHVLVGGTLQRKTFYNWLETYTENTKVWERGTRVDAATNQPIGDWKAHWNR